MIGIFIFCAFPERSRRVWRIKISLYFYKNVGDLSEKIIKISRDDKLRKKIARNGKKKYMKFFNSDVVSNYIINKTLGLKNKKKYLWEY